MSEQSALLKLIGLLTVFFIWVYMMTSKDPEIVKKRNRTQKLIYTGVGLFVLILIFNA
jgi:NADH:ubiquinone oxidoreductase subunit 6 (subunit J)